MKAGSLRPRLHDNKFAVYPGQFKFVLVKISPDSERSHGRHAKENQPLVTFLTTGNLSGLPCLQECANTEHIKISSALL